MSLFRRVNVPLDNLKFRWEHSMFNSRKHKAKMRYFRNYSKDDIIYNPIWHIQESMRKRGMSSSLIIKQSHYNQSFDFSNNYSYVLIGNQRLVALKSMNQKDLEGAIHNTLRKVPCIIAEDESPWGDNNPASKSSESDALVGINIFDLQYDRFEIPNSNFLPEEFSGLMDEYNKKQHDISYEKVVNQNQWFLEAEKTLGKEVEPNDKLDSLIKVYESLKKEKTMWNPLIVKSETDGMLYVVKGKQRLCALRALGFKDLVPCRVFSGNKYKIEDILELYPYTEIE